MSNEDQTQRWNAQLAEVRSQVSGIGVAPHADLRLRAHARTMCLVFAIRQPMS